jgi:hypothetical protein
MDNDKNWAADFSKGWHVTFKKKRKAHDEPGLIATLAKKFRAEFAAATPADLIADGIFLFALILLGVGGALVHLSIGLISVAMVLLYTILRREAGSIDPK